MSDNFQEQEIQLSQEEAQIEVLNEKSEALTSEREQQKASFNISLSELLDVLYWVQTLQ